MWRAGEPLIQIRIRKINDCNKIPYSRYRSSLSPCRSRTRSRSLCLSSTLFRERSSSSLSNCVFVFLVDFVIKLQSAAHDTRQNKSIQSIRAFTKRQIAKANNKQQSGCARRSSNNQAKKYLKKINGKTKKWQHTHAHTYGESALKSLLSKIWKVKAKVKTTVRFILHSQKYIFY